MKTKKLKKEIKEHIYSLTPDVIDKIDFHSIQIEENLETSFEAKRTALKLSFGFGGVLAFTVILFLILSAVITPGPVVETRALSLDTKEEIYTISSFSSVALLYQNKQAAEMITTLSFTENELDEPLIDSHISILNQYLNFLEPLLTNKEVATFEIKKSSLAGYSKQITFSSLLLSETPVAYTLFYNETKVGNKTLMDGLMLFLSEEYEFIGTLEIKDEKEEFKLEAFEKSNRSNYIKVTQKKENNKQKFKYNLYKFNEEVFESEIKIEIKDNTVLIELEYESNSKEIEFEIVKQLNNNVIYVEYEIEAGEFNEEGEIYITVVFNHETGKNVYHYNILSNDEEREFERERIFSDDDDDDDDDDELDEDEIDEDEDLDDEDHDDELDDNDDDELDEDNEIKNYFSYNESFLII